ncbi:MAG TPA: hypothetical protein VGE74_12105 [Gemmata sp.]
MVELPDAHEPLTLAALFSQPDNEGVWRYLNARVPDDVRSFEAGADGSPFDEGGQIFFHRYGRLLPASARCVVCAKVSNNLLAHELTGRVFALHTGRFTIALRTGFAGAGGSLCGVTLDGPIDHRVLGPGWLLFHEDGDDETVEAFRRAHVLAGEGASRAEPGAAPDTTG